MIKLYVSGTPQGSDEFLREEAARSTYRLFSLHGNYLPAVMRWVEKAKTFPKLPSSILLDSGAFTAWNKGHHTQVEEVIYAYKLFLDATKGMFEHVYAINLDVIPGEAGRTPTQKEIEDAVKQSDVNFKILTKEFGGIILPVFHQGEDDARLAVVANQAPYVCISPRNDVAETHRVKWAHETHCKLSNKTHGLATTGTKMLSVPWHSVDSATAIHIAAYGMLMFAVDGELRKIFVTLDDEKHKLVDKHIDTLSPYMQEKCMRTIEEDIFPIKELRSNVKSRILFNIKQLLTYTGEAKVQEDTQLTLF